MSGRLPTANNGFGFYLPYIFKKEERRNGDPKPRGLPHSRSEFYVFPNSKWENSSKEKAASPPLLLLKIQQCLILLH